MPVKLHARFLKNLEALTGSELGPETGIEPNDADARLGIAVSGGPDSMALLSLARQAWGSRVSAATVNHQLRDESTAEAEMVAAYCKKQCIEHSILTPAQPITGNIQSEARAVRYGLLNDWAADNNITWIATAHHGDDQLETILMRLARGAGLDGLRGVRARNGHIIRPLLNAGKAELVDYCESKGIPFVTDPSNSNDDYDRVRMRHMLEKLASENLDMFDALAAGRSAAALNEAGQALDWIVVREAGAHVTEDNDCLTLTQTAYPREIQRRLLLYCVNIIAPGLRPRGDTQSRALDALNRGEKTMIGDILCEGGNMWTFRAAPPRNSK